MMRALLLVALSLAIASSAVAAPLTGARGPTPPRSQRTAPRIELITVEPGEDVWSRFGHTCLRVRTERSDTVYSFGYAPFDQPAFMYEFLRGNALFGVGAESWDYTVTAYRPFNRTMVRQTLDLDERQAQALSDALKQHLQPGHNLYRYDQLRDNCATRIRDLIDAATDGALRKVNSGPTGRRYRDHTMRAAADRPLLSFALDFVGGPNQETQLDGWAEMFLPHYLREAVQQAPPNGRPLNTETIPVLLRKGPPTTAGVAYAGRHLFLALCLVVTALVVWTRRSGRALRLAGAFLGAFGGWIVVWALLIDALVGVSRVADFAWNENVLAWLPTDAVLCVIGWRWLRGNSREMGVFWSRYLRARPLWAGLLATLTWAGVLPQDNLVYIVGPALVFAALAYPQPAAGVR